MRHLWSLVLCVFAACSVKCDGTIQECFRRDSIACVQTEIFREARSMMDQPILDVFGGITLAKNNARRPQNEMKDMMAAVENSTDVMSRQDAIDKYLVRRARSLVLEGTVQWNIGKTVKALAKSLLMFLPPQFPTWIIDGRAKGAALWKALTLPLKLKSLGVAVVFSLLAIAFLAKHAVAASLISLLVSGFISLKKLLGTTPPPPPPPPVIRAGPALVWNPAPPPPALVPWPLDLPATPVTPESPPVPAPLAVSAPWPGGPDGRAEFASAGAPTAQRLAYRGRTAAH